MIRFVLALVIGCTILLVGAASCTPASSQTTIRESAISARAPSRPDLPELPLLPGAVRLPPDSPVQGQYLYDRNALWSSAEVGAYRVAVTEAGHLLVFDRDFALVREQLVPVDATCLGPATNDSIVVGFSDGSIARVSVPSLEGRVLAPGSVLTPGFVMPRKLGPVEGIAALPGSGRLVAILGDQNEESYLEAATKPLYTVRVLESGKETAVLGASEFLMDTDGGLWLGADHGEWGGTLQRVEPESGRVENVEIPDGVGGIYGIAQVGSEVWIYGGMSHMGFLEAGIARVSPGKPKVLYRGNAFSWGAPVDLKQRPVGPISQLLVLGDRVLALAFQDLFESDRRLKQWTWRTRLDAFAQPGRPDAVGSYPAVRTIDTDGDRLVLTTQRDGFVEYSNGRTTGHALASQLPVAPSFGIASRDELVLVGHGRNWTVALHGGAWVAATTLLPDPQSFPSDGSGVVSSDWCRTNFFRTNDGALGVVARRGSRFDLWQCSSGDDENGLLVSGVVDSGGFHERSRQMTSFDPFGAFALPDGAIAAQGRDWDLWTVEGGAFHPRSGKEMGLRLEQNLGKLDDGWLVLAGGRVQKLRLSATGGIELERIGETIGIFDAVRLSRYEALIADEIGLWIYDVRSTQRTPFLPQGTFDRIEALEIDARGRLWGLGEQLHLLRRGAEAVGFPLPYVNDLGPHFWPQHHDMVTRGNQIFVVLSERGLLAIDADRTVAAAM